MQATLTAAIPLSSSLPRSVRIITNPHPHHRDDDDDDGDDDAALNVLTSFIEDVYAFHLLRSLRSLWPRQHGYMVTSLRLRRTHRVLCYATLLLLLFFVEWGDNSGGDDESSFFHFVRPVLALNTCEEVERCSECVYDPSTGMMPPMLHCGWCESKHRCLPVNERILSYYTNTNTSMSSEEKTAFIAGFCPDLRTDVTGGTCPDMQCSAAWTTNNMYACRAASIMAVVFAVLLLAINAGAALWCRTVWQLPWRYEPQLSELLRCEMNDQHNENYNRSNEWHGGVHNLDDESFAHGTTTTKVKTAMGDGVVAHEDVDTHTSGKSAHHSDSTRKGVTLFESISSSAAAAGAAKDVPVSAAEHSRDGTVTPSEVQRVSFTGVATSSSAALRHHSAPHDGDSDGGICPICKMNQPKRLGPGEVCFWCGVARMCYMPLLLGTLSAVFSIIVMYSLSLKPWFSDWYYTYTLGLAYATYAALVGYIWRNRNRGIPLFMTTVTDTSSSPDPSAPYSPLSQPHASVEPSPAHREENEGRRAMQRTSYVQLALFLRGRSLQQCFPHLTPHVREEALGANESLSSAPSQANRLFWVVSPPTTTPSSSAAALHAYALPPKSSMPVPIAPLPPLATTDAAVARIRARRQREEDTEDDAGREEEELKPMSLERRPRSHRNDNERTTEIVITPAGATAPKTVDAASVPATCEERVSSTSSSRSSGSSSSDDDDERRNEVGEGRGGEKEGGRRAMFPPQHHKHVPGHVRARVATATLPPSAQDSFAAPTADAAVSGERGAVQTGTPPSSAPIASEAAAAAAVSSTPSLPPGVLLAAQPTHSLAQPVNTWGLRGGPWPQSASNSDIGGTLSSMHATTTTTTFNSPLLSSNAATTNGATGGPATSPEGGVVSGGGPHSNVHVVHSQSNVQQGHHSGGVGLASTSPFFPSVPPPSSSSSPSSPPPPASSAPPRALPAQTEALASAVANPTSSSSAMESRAAGAGLGARSPPAPPSAVPPGAAATAAALGHGIIGNNNMNSAASKGALPLIPANSIPPDVLRQKRGETAQLLNMDLLDEPYRKALRATLYRDECILWTAQPDFRSAMGQDEWLVVDLAVGVLLGVWLITLATLKDESYPIVRLCGSSAMALLGILVLVLFALLLAATVRSFTRLYLLTSERLITVYDGLLSPVVTTTDVSSVRHAAIYGYADMFSHRRVLNFSWETPVLERRLPPIKSHSFPGIVQVKEFLHFFHMVAPNLPAQTEHSSASMEHERVTWRVHVGLCLAVLLVLPILTIYAYGVPMAMSIVLYFLLAAIVLVTIERGLRTQRVTYAPLNWAEEWGAAVEGQEDSDELNAETAVAAVAEAATHTAGGTPSSHTTKLNPASCAAAAAGGGDALNGAPHSSQSVNVHSYGGAGKSLSVTTATDTATGGGGEEARGRAGHGVKDNVADVDVSESIGRTAAMSGGEYKEEACATRGGGGNSTGLSANAYPLPPPSSSVSDGVGAGFPQPSRGSTTTLSSSSPYSYLVIPPAAAAAVGAGCGEAKGGGGVFFTTTATPAQEATARSLSLPSSVTPAQTANSHVSHTVSTPTGSFADAKPPGGVPPSLPHTAPGTARATPIPDPTVYPTTASCRVSPTSGRVHQLPSANSVTGSPTGSATGGGGGTTDRSTAFPRRLSPHHHSFSSAIPEVTTTPPAFGGDASPVSNRSIVRSDAGPLVMSSSAAAANETTAALAASSSGFTENGMTVGEHVAIAVSDTLPPLDTTWGSDTAATPRVSSGGGTAVSSPNNHSP